MNRTIITLECSVCKERNYTTTKNKLPVPQAHRSQGDQIGAPPHAEQR
ncbi:MAG: 50S ribosomal protein L33 [Deltaproteobacteria bacterium]|nr:MAG: 50S ribosomal protein L33 [Deltaproteobacteria bacterium]